MRKKSTIDHSDHSGPTKMDQQMCQGSATIHKLLSKKGSKHKQQIMRQQGIPLSTFSDSSFSEEASSDERKRDGYRRPVGSSSMSDKQERAYDSLPPTPPPYMNQRSFDNVPPEMKASQYKKHSKQHNHQSRDVPKNRPPPKDIIENPGPQDNNQGRQTPTKQKDAKMNMGEQSPPNSMKAINEVSSNVGRVMAALGRVGHLDDDVEDYVVKLDTLKAMRDVVMQQQEALKSMSTQNHDYRRKLGVAQTKFHSFHQSQMDQMSMIEKLQMEKDSFESEALLLREENDIMRQELERLRKQTQSSHIFQKTQKTIDIPDAPTNTAANLNLQRERDFSKKAANNSTLNPCPPPNEIDGISSPPLLHNLKASSERRSPPPLMQTPSNYAPDPPEEKLRTAHHNSNARRPEGQIRTSSVDSNSRREEYLRDMVFVRSVLSKYEKEAEDNFFDEDIGDESINLSGSGFENSRDRMWQPAPQRQSGNPKQGNRKLNPGEPPETFFANASGKGVVLDYGVSEFGYPRDRRRQAAPQRQNETPRRTMDNLYPGEPPETFFSDASGKDESLNYRDSELENLRDRRRQAPPQHHHETPSQPLDNQRPEQSPETVLSNSSQQYESIDYNRSEFENLRDHWSQAAQQRQNHHQNEIQRQVMGHRNPGQLPEAELAHTSQYEPSPMSEQNMTTHGGVPNGSRSRSSPEATMHFPARGENNRAKQYVKALDQRRFQESPREQENQPWRASSSPRNLETMSKPQEPQDRNPPPDSRGSLFSDLDDDFDSLGSTDQEEENKSLGAAPISFQNMEKMKEISERMNDISESDRRVLTAAVYQHRIQRHRRRGDN